jgi:hypothetical protein
MFTGSLRLLNLSTILWLCHFTLHNCILTQSAFLYIGLFWFCTAWLSSVTYSVDSRVFPILLWFESLFLTLFHHLICHSGTVMTSIFVTWVFTTHNLARPCVLCCLFWCGKHKSLHNVPAILASFGIPPFCVTDFESIFLCHCCHSGSTHCVFYMSFLAHLMAQ